MKHHIKDSEELDIECSSVDKNKVMDRGQRDDKFKVSIIVKETQVMPAKNMDSNTVETLGESANHQAFESMMWKTLEPMTYVMKISFVFIEPMKRGSSVILYGMKWCVAILLASLYVADAVRVSFVFRSVRFDSFNDRLSVLFAFIGFVWTLPLVAMGTLYVTTSTLIKLKHSMIEYEKQYGFVLHRRVLFKSRNQFYVFMLVQTLESLLFIALILFLLSEDAVIMSLLVGFEYSNITDKILPITLQCFKTAFASVILGSISTFYYYFGKIIGFEYSNVTEALRKLVKTDCFEDIESSFGSHRKQYEAVTSLLEKANPILQTWIILSYTTCVPEICFLVYGLANGQLHAEDTFSLLPMFLMNVFSMLFFTVVGIGMNDKAHEVNDVLYQMDLDKLSEKTTSQVNVFISRVNGSSLGISVYGMFVVDASSLLMLFGTILTYSIVIWQTSGEIQCNCNSNFTSVVSL